MNSDLIIKGKFVLPMVNDQWIENGAVVVSGGSILSVGKAGDLEKKYKAKRTINIGNGIVMPGLINTHTHAAMACFRGLADDLPLKEWLENNIWPAEQKHVNEDFVRRSGGLAILEMLKSGITCFNDMYFFEEVLGDIASGVGMRAILGEVILDFPTPSAKNPQRAIQKTLEQIDRFKNNDLVDVAFAPHSIYACSADNLQKVNELALANDALIHIHISETEKELSDCLESRRKTPVKYLYDMDFLSERVVSVHSVWLKKGDLDLLRKKNVKISHNPISNMKLASGISPIIEMTREYGLIVGLGTDGAASNNTMDLFSEMRTCSVLHKVTRMDPEILNSYEIVKMVTADAARVLGKEKELGTLEAGKGADIITIDLDKPHLTPIYNPFSHLVYCVGPQDVNGVIINGKIVMENREVKNIDEKKVLREAVF